MTRKDEAFKILLKKEIYEFLEGSGEPLLTYKGVQYGMPYYTANQLETICTDLGYVDFTPGSRWTYVEGLLRYAISTGRCDEVLKYFFNIERFEQLREIGSMEEIDTVYQSLFSAAISFINTSIKLTRKELVYTGNRFFIVDAGKAPIIVAPVFHELDLPYVRGLQERCKDDFLAGNYDSVITKSRTMMEEILVKILEENSCENIPRGKVIDQYNLVKRIYGLQQSRDYDERVNLLLGGLERIVQAIAQMRNADSDAHGVGSKRINVRDYEARLIMNSSITFSEYILSVRERRKTSGTK